MKDFCVSSDGETFEFEFATREDALAEGRELYPDQTIWTGRACRARLVTGWVSISLWCYLRARRGLRRRRSP